MTTLLVVLAVGAGSYLMRSGPILWHGRAQPPPWVDRAALLAATSALSAVVTSAVLHHERAGHPEARLAAIVAVAVALVLASRRVSMLRVIVAGLAIYELASLALAARLTSAGALAPRSPSEDLRENAPSAGFEPAHTAPEADALSPELRGRAGSG